MTLELTSDEMQTLLLALITAAATDAEDGDGAQVNAYQQMEERLRSLARDHALRASKPMKYEEDGNILFAT